MPACRVISGSRMVNRQRLGIGPADRGRIKPITQRFKLYGAAPAAKGGELNVAPPCHQADS
jgi:hypothetical protein